MVNKTSTFLKNVVLHLSTYHITEYNIWCIDLIINYMVYIYIYIVYHYEWYRI